MFATFGICSEIHLDLPPPPTSCEITYQVTKNILWAQNENYFFAFLSR